MKGWDGATRKNRDTAIVCSNNKNSVPRVLKPSDIRRRVEDVLMHVLAVALLLAFPDSTVRDTARFVMKASATAGSLTSAGRHAGNGHSRRQMAGVVEAPEQGSLQRLITHSLRKQAMPFIMPVRAGRKMAACWNSGRHSFTTVHALKSGVESIDLRVQAAKRREHGRIRSYYFTVCRVCTSPKQTMQLYRRRFGIESSCRIAEMARARTSSRETAARQLNMFVAVLIENEWVIAEMLYASGRHRGSPVVLDELIRFRHLLLMIVCSLNKIYGESHIVENRGPPQTEALRLLDVVR